MKSDKKILIAFYLNLFFSLLELVGGTITGSIAIISDAIHDFGDSLSIGTSLVLEKISKKGPDDKYTYGYYRYSVLGSVIQSVVLLFGSAMVGYNAVIRLINPVPINYNGMIIFGIIGVAVNFVATCFTSGEGSLNQRSINLHMLEDVFGWAIVLVGAVVMRFTNWAFLDAILSLALAIFIIVGALKGLKSAIDIFLEKTPDQVDIEKLRERLLSVEGVEEVHHLHIWSMDGYRHSATLHAVIRGEFAIVKSKIKEELFKQGISHSTVECEAPTEHCHDEHCDNHYSVVPEEAHHHHH